MYMYFIYRLDLTEKPWRKCLAMFMTLFCLYSWQADPEHPFVPPEHLRDAVDHFEKTEVPRLGLKPHVVAPPTSEEAVSASHAPSAPDEVDFVFS